jgi:hypothetical protein
VQPLTAGWPRADDALPHHVGDGSVTDRRLGAQRLPDVPPHLRDLGDDVQAGAHVLAALGVVRRQRGQRQRERGLAHLLALVERTDVERELRRVAADLGERSQPGRPVERAVLDALGHHHPGRLLEPHGGGVSRIAEARQDRVDHRRQVGPPPHRVVGCGREVLGTEREVRPVHREAGEQFGDRVVRAHRRATVAGELTLDASHLAAQ